ncbi:hypothetical protein BDV24DRAFT_127277 [Aspergillus arachidicola]|uniref:Uncharacterized protein n=1 Tax=Aspergillus arachidicola TaxID=656916 RepID=A0A5N6YG54_9EURO|nr:hypothetical protein BDV24DRAFT_127277 [Aspergillus arachidicola]
MEHTLVSLRAFVFYTGASCYGDRLRNRVSIRYFLSLVMTYVLCTYIRSILRVFRGFGNYGILIMVHMWPTCGGVENRYLSRRKQAKRRSRTVLVVECEIRSAMGGI